MSKKTGILVTVMAAAALCLSLASFCVSVRTLPEQRAQEVQEVQYVMYLGTNDKDTNEPVYAPDEAKSLAEEILVDYFGGYTIQDADGGWIDADGTLFQEYTIVIELSDTTMEQVHAAADSLISAFHQSAVLIQSNPTMTEFYSGV